MKKLLLISALLLAGLVPAKADRLPKEFVGTWCSNTGDDYWTPTSEKSPDNTDNMNFRRDGYSQGGVVWCRFISVKNLGWTDIKTIGVRIVASCIEDDAQGGKWKSNLELYLTKGFFLEIKRNVK